MPTTYATKYSIPFKGVNGVLYTITIRPDGYMGAITELKAGPDPVIIEDPNTDKLTPVRGKGATIQFYNAGLNLRELFTSDPFGVQIRIDSNTPNETIFSGYLNTEQYTEDLSRSNSLVTIVANDGLAAINREKYFTATAQSHLKQRATLASIITTCLSSLGITTYRAIFEIREANNTGPVYLFFSQVTHDLAAYIDEDGTSFTKREVLEKTLTAYGLTISLLGTRAYIYCISSLKTQDLTIYQYNSSFTYSSTYTLNNLYSYGTHFKYIGGGQRLNIIGGLTDLTLNYYPYPQPQKVVPFASALRDFVEDYPAATHVQYLDDPSYTAGYWYQLSPTKDFAASQGVYFYDNGYMARVLDGENTLSPATEDMAEATFIAFKDLSTASDTTNAIRFDCGYLSLGGNTLPNGLKDNLITIHFKLRIQFDKYPTTSIQISRTLIPFSIKCGTKWGKRNPGRISFTETTEQILYAGVGDMFNANGDQRRKELDVIIQLENITEAGQLVIYFKKNAYLYFTQNDNYTESPIIKGLNGANTIVMMRDFSVKINMNEISDEALEFGGTLNNNYTTNQTIEVNHGDLRTNGALDRGLILINNAITANWYFNNQGSGTTYPLYKMLLRLYLSELGDKHNEIKADIKGNMFGIASGESGVLSPISVLQDTANIGPEKYMLCGGSYNMRQQVFSGTFRELKGITE